MRGRKEMNQCSCSSKEQLLLRVKQNEKAISQLISMISHLNRKIAQLQVHQDS